MENIIQISTEVHQALATRQAVVALESAVITHGLPAPQNLETALAMEQIVRDHGALPATVAVINGKVRLGLSAEELEKLAASDGHAVKVSSRDFGMAIAGRKNGGTTVAGTLMVAARTGVKVFATGGIGGVHRGMMQDISNDLFALSSAPVVVVCSGAKAILDLPATLETLETYGVPVVGYQTDELPAFYSRSSGIQLPMRADNPETVVNMAQAQWDMGLRSGLVVAQPIPKSDEIPSEEIEGVIRQAVTCAEARGLHGAAVTPFLLAQVGEYTKGRSLKANIALLKNNARLAAEIAAAFTRLGAQKSPVT